MDFTQAVSTCFQKYATFTGRATRAEYWWFVLFGLIASIVASMVGELVNALVSLALLVPSISVGARRLHDIGKTGWFQLLWIVPVIGWVILIYWAVQPGEGPNAYGNPAVTPDSPTVLPGPGQQ